MSGTSGSLGSGLGHPDHNTHTGATPNTTTAAATTTGNGSHPGGHDPYAEQAKKESMIGKVELAIGKAIHSTGLVAKGEAHLEHAHIVSEQGINAPGAHHTTADVQREREALAETPNLAGGAEAPGPGGVADPVVAGPGGQSGLAMPGMDHTRGGQY